MTRSQLKNESVDAVWFRPPKTLTTSVLVAGIIGLLLVVLGYWTSNEGWRRLQLGYLVAFAYVLSLSLGSLFFVLIQHLMRAGWSVAIRRPAEIFGFNIICVAVLAIPIGWFVWQGELYPWAKYGDQVESASEHGVSFARHVSIDELAKGSKHPSDTVHGSGAKGHEAGHGHDLYIHQKVDELTQSKANWLNRPGFLLRMVLYFAIWFGLVGFYWRQSQAQDRSVQGIAQTLSMERWAGPALIVFAVTLTLASFDWLMSLDPHWYSTIFGVYFFAGCTVGALALNLLVLQWMGKDSPLTKNVSIEHRRDLGRLLFAFVFFWGYIAFSQYLLLWYANVPETTRWFVIRGASTATGYANSWGWLLVALLFGNFILPFLGLMSRHVKSSPRAVRFWTLWLLVMHYLDLYWLVMPELGPSFTIGPIEIGCWITVFSIWLMSAVGLATQISLIPIGDPRLDESLRLVDAY
ncbi:MAG: hypothetical protein Q8M16_11100 [Pirellulaceae bacterium]|nr:hypothetical protein [Pirellulaceae bacterium]